MIYYDLHIHSCLSPCADDDMTPNNIVNMALLNGLKLISVTDHNSFLQQESVAQLCASKGLLYLYGAELTSREEVHVLAYFNSLEKAFNFSLFIDEHLIKILNKPKYFGHQYVRDIGDNIIKEEARLLLSTLDLSIEDLTMAIKDYGGLSVLAHIDRSANGILNRLGFIPRNLYFDGIEYCHKDHFSDYQKLKAAKKLFLRSSDAHRLIDIAEQENYLDAEIWEGLFR